MSGKLLATFLVLAALVAGGAMFYLQVYGYYDRLSVTGPEDVVLTRLDGTTEPVSHVDFQAIDSESSPIRYRGCFKTNVPITELAAHYQAAEEAVPLHAPFWFDCFDAEKIGEALEQGQAQAFMSIAHVTYGIDRIAAVFPNGQGVVWQQINRCGEKAFDGDPVPDGCPPPLETF